MEGLLFQRIWYDRRVSVLDESRVQTPVARVSIEEPQESSS